MNSSLDQAISQIGSIFNESVKKHSSLRDIRLEIISRMERISDRFADIEVSLKSVSVGKGELSAVFRFTPAGCETQEKEFQTNKWMFL